MLVEIIGDDEDKRDEGSLREGALFFAKRNRGGKEERNRERGWNEQKKKKREKQEGDGSVKNKGK